MMKRIKTGISYTFSDVKALIIDMEIGEMKVIEVPEKLPTFRKYLTEVSVQVLRRKFTTKVVQNKLYICRIPYTSIFEKINMESKKRKAK